VSSVRSRNSSVDRWTALPRLSTTVGRREPAGGSIGFSCTKHRTKLDTPRTKRVAQLSTEHCGRFRQEHGSAAQPNPRAQPKTLQCVKEQLPHMTRDDACCAEAGGYNHATRFAG